MTMPPEVSSSSISGLLLLLQVRAALVLLQHIAS
jgi:hypothetical protein